MGNQVPRKYHFEDGSVVERSLDIQERANSYSFDPKSSQGNISGEMLHESRSLRPGHSSMDEVSPMTAGERAYRSISPSNKPTLDKKAPLPERYSPTRFSERPAKRKDQLTAESERRLEEKIKALMAHISTEEYGLPSNLNEIWERFLMMRSDGSSSSASVREPQGVASDVERLAGVTRSSESETEYQTIPKTVHPAGSVHRPAETSGIPAKPAIALATGRTAHADEIAQQTREKRDLGKPVDLVGGISATQVDPRPKAEVEVNKAQLEGPPVENVAAPFIPVVGQEVKPSQKVTSAESAQNISETKGIQDISDVSRKSEKRDGGVGTDKPGSSEATKEQIQKGAKTSDSGDNSNGKKMAWVIQDESLPIVPEDSTLDSVSSDPTTTSSYEADGKIVMRTTKRHLPDDPKLLKLQHKIAKQKEKHKHDYLRERRRKEKIVTLERMLAEQNLSLARVKRVGVEDKQRAGQSRNKATSTPSQVEPPDSSSTSQASTLTISDISSSSTLTPPSTFISDHSITLTDKDTSPERSVRFSDKKQNKRPGLCTCGQTKQSHSLSQKKRTETKKEQPEYLSLKEVDYDHRGSAAANRSKRGVYMEYEAPLTRRDKPDSMKTESRRPTTDNKKHRDRNHEKKSSKEEYFQENKRTEKIQKQSKKLTKEATNLQLQVSKPDQEFGKREFGQTYPSPRMSEPKAYTAKGKKVMVISLGTQTSIENETAENVSPFIPLPDKQYLTERVAKGLDMLIPDSEQENQEENQQGTRKQKVTVRAGQSKCILCISTVSSDWLMMKANIFHVSLKT